MEIRLRPEPDYGMVSMSRIERANIGSRYHTAKLTAIDDDTVQKEPLLNYVKTLPKNLEKGYGLILRGPDGVGKTAAACRILMEAMARGPVNTYFVLAQNIDHHAMNRRDRTEDGGSVWNMIVRDAHFLVIDDLAAERKTEWTSQWVELVLTERYHRLLPTIVTTNPGDEDVFDRYPRLKQLAADSYKVIAFTGQNWRG